MEASFGDETRLILYALQSQAERGPCEPRSKWGMAAEERAKHETWANLGKMEPFEAMRLFVKLLDDERPGWWKEDVGAPGGGTIARVRASPGGAAETDTRREEETRVIVSPVRAVARNHSRARESRARGGDDSRDDDDDQSTAAVVNEWCFDGSVPAKVFEKKPSKTDEKKKATAKGYRRLKKFRWRKFLTARYWRRDQRLVKLLFVVYAFVAALLLYKRNAAKIKLFFWKRKVEKLRANVANAAEMRMKSA